MIACRWFAVLWAAGLLASCAAAPAGSTSVKEAASLTATASGQPIRLPQGDAKVVLFEYVIPPGAKLPVHQHPHPRIALVESGTISVTNVDAGTTVVYTAGDLIVESVGQWHFGETLGAAEVRLRVFDLLPAGVATNVVPRK